MVQQLKKDKSRIILATDKGMALVVMDRKDYLEKAKNLLEQSAYSELTSDPTDKYKAKLITIPKRIKKNWQLRTTHASACIQQGQVLKSSTTFLKSTKRKPPLTNHIKQVSVTYGEAKESVGILQPLVDNTLHHI